MQESTSYTSNMPVSDALGQKSSDPCQLRRTVTSHPYPCSIGSSASSSSTSVFSLDCVSSQGSVSSSSTTATDALWESDETREPVRKYVPHPGQTSFPFQDGSACNPSKVTECVVPPELRKNPRRTAYPSTASNGAPTSCSRLPPPLVRQCDRKVNFVDSLVGKSFCPLSMQ